MSRIPLPPTQSGLLYLATEKPNRKPPATSESATPQYHGKRFIVVKTTAKGNKTMVENMNKTFNIPFITLNYSTVRKEAKCY